MSAQMQEARGGEAAEKAREVREQELAERLKKKMKAELAFTSDFGMALSKLASDIRFCYLNQSESPVLTLAC
jgi:hypothetical protein